jgi:hypothetical protein
MCRLLVVLALQGSMLVAAAGLSAAPPRPPAFERAVEVAGPGRLAIALDRDVYEGARADLADLRVIDDQGREVPYWLDRGEAASSEHRQPEIRNRGFLRGRQATAVLDFGSAFSKSGLGLSLSGDNFRRRVVAEGSQDERTWATLTDDAYVFAVPPPDAARYEWIRLPPGDHRWVRVTVFHGPDDPGRIEIKDAWAEAGRAASAERPVALVTESRAEDPERRETILTLDLGARHQPFRAVLLDVQDARFFRGVTVEARREPAQRRPRDRPASVTWARLGDGAIYRYEEGGRTRESLRVEVAGRERVVRLRLRNRDDRPLGLGVVAVLAPVERLVFESAEGRRYRLTYGQPELPAPQYDLVRTLPDPRAWVAGAAPAGLAAAAPRVTQAAHVPWSERHPALLWAGLLGAVAALGALTWGALKRAP